MTDLIKYPRTMHLPFSNGRTDDDKVLTSVDHFIDKIVVVTEKMDGENSTLYRNNYHARSIDSRHHPSRDWLKAFHANIRYLIPEGWRICGENLFAKHSVAYDDLDSYFYGFSIWTEQNVCLDWDSTIEWFQLLNITPVPAFYKGTFNERLVRAFADGVDASTQEGFVVRLADSFAYEDFSSSVAKWVRDNHVQTDEHWMSRQVVPNKLKNI